MNSETVFLIIPSKGILRDPEAYSFPGGIEDKAKCKTIFDKWVEYDKREGTYKSSEWDEDGGRIYYKNGTYMSFLFADLYGIEELEEN